VFSVTVDEQNSNVSEWRKIEKLQKQLIPLPTPAIRQ